MEGKAIPAKILIVEDQVALARVLGEALRHELVGSEVSVATNAAQARSMAEELGGVDLLLTDHHLGDANGVELSELLRARFPQMRTLIYTGRANPAVVRDAGRIGARVLWKPQRLHTLIREIRAELA